MSAASSPAVTYASGSSPSVNGNEKSQPARTPRSRIRSSLSPGGALERVAGEAQRFLRQALGLLHDEPAPGVFGRALEPLERRSTRRRVGGGPGVALERRSGSVVIGKHLGELDRPVARGPFQPGA